MKDTDKVSVVVEGAPAQLLAAVVLRLALRRKRQRNRVRFAQEVARLTRHEVRFSPAALKLRAQNRLARAIFRGAKRTLRRHNRRFTETGAELVYAFAQETAPDLGLALRVARRSAMPFEAIEKLVGKAK